VLAWTLLSNRKNPAEERYLNLSFPRKRESRLDFGRAALARNDTRSLPFLAAARCQGLRHTLLSLAGTVLFAPPVAHFAADGGTL
jgi:hypothetical protein